MESPVRRKDLRVFEGLGHLSGVSDVEALLVSEQLTVDAGEVHTLKHYDVPHDLTSHEYILHVLIRDKVVKPVFAKLRDSTHGKEVRRLQLLV